MATPQLLTLLLFIASTTASLLRHSTAENTPEKPHAFIVPVAREKRPYNGVFYSAEIVMGTKPTVSVNVVVDLGGRFTWFVCSNAHYNSYRTVSYISPKCKLFEDPGMTSNCYPNGTCSEPLCGVDVNHPYSARNYHVSVVSQDVMSFISTPDGLRLGPRLDSPQLVFACADDEAIEEPFPASSLGAIGLSRNVFSLPNQLTSSFKLPRKFALCLPSKPKTSARGDLFIGGGPYFYPPYQGDASRLFVTAPFVHQSPHLYIALG
ncbi:PREDICTED: basic 7S globulin 2-like [Tarenaya hassleriana]|uniref:basic 7S globulin 2-like n=1 Tax=Tarenaya hassleriana TaxID=28532 RepID=UPI00053C2B6A|nr:PREDICTED: basic 7S globulin 2-like [Tarenaya hassleriana]